jgi:hypothetical protein
MAIIESRMRAKARALVRHLPTVLGHWVLVRTVARRAGQNATASPVHAAFTKRQFGSSQQRKRRSLHARYDLESPALGTPHAADHHLLDREIRRCRIWIAHRDRLVSRR